MDGKHVAGQITRAALGVGLALSFAISGQRAATAQIVGQQVSNASITAGIGTSGAANGINGAGRMFVSTVGQTPVSLMTLANSGLGSFATLRIDGGEPADPGQDGTVVGWDIPIGDVGGNGATDEGAWIQPPTVVGNTIEAIWRTLPGGGTFPIPSIEVAISITLKRDQACFQFSITNLDTASHTLGLRFAQDIGATFQKPVLTPIQGVLNNETNLIATQVPNNWRIVGSGDGTDLSQLSSVGSPLAPALGATSPTKPDRVVFGRASAVLSDLWTITTTGANFTGATADAAVALFFNEQVYFPSQTRTITTYYGKQIASLVFGNRLTTGMEAPFSLKFANGVFTPSPFSVQAGIQNHNTITVTNIRITLSLPAGLKLAAGETATKVIASAAPDQTVSASWNVEPDTATPRFGKLVMSASVTADPGGQSSTVTRDIELPPAPGAATPFPAGTQMVSFPFVFDNPIPTAALGMSAIEFDLIRWNSGLNLYEAVREIKPGEGYWMRLPAGRNVALSGAHPIETGTPQFEVKLNRDWNQISNPYSYRVLWGDVLVINTDIADPDFLRPVTIDEAAAIGRRWILPTLYRYNTETGSYEFEPDLSMPMEPFRGYWVKALKPNISLLIPVAIGGRSGKTSYRKADLVPGAGNWRMRLVASSGRLQDAFNFIGIDPGAGNGSVNVEEPPVIADALQLSLVKRESGRSSLLASDIRTNTVDRKEWDVVITSPKANQDVVLTWPDINTVPKGYELTVRDMVAGTRRSMRDASSLKFNTGDSGTRAFKITAEPRNIAGVFRISQWNVSGRSNSANITFTGTADANYTVTVVGATGRSLRQLVSRAGNAGTATAITWDYKDGRGIAVPAGTYNIEIRGVTNTGQSARIVVPHLVTR